MKMRFRTKVFIGSVAAAAAALLVVALLMSWEVRARERATLEGQLTAEARLISAVLAASSALTGPQLDVEADRLGKLVSSRVTLIDASGVVVGDSTLSDGGLAALDNHSSRPEVLAAGEGSVGISRRFSTTIGTDMVYVAVGTAHPVVRYVRVALPLTAVDDRLAAIRNVALVALAAGIPVALVVSWLVSAPLARRVRAIAAVANRYSTGDLTRPAVDDGADELGTVARALDTAAWELGRRIEDLSRDRALMEAILSGMAEGVLVIDYQGRIQLVNRAAREMLRVDESAMGRPYVEVIRHPDIAAQLGATLRGQEADSRELALSRDPTRTFIARAAPVGSREGGAVLVLHDITDLRRADRIRQDFVANVSHELRTPLTAIRGYVEALLDEPADPTHARNFLEIIGRHSARMERLVADLLRLARLDARQEPLDAVPCDARQLLEGVAADLAPTIDGKRQRVVVQVADDARVLRGDPTKLHDVVRNLVENASHYSPADAEIRLATARQGDTLLITVADTGPGIPPLDLTRIFERFYRVDQSRSRPGGTGLGLAIVKHLVELHGGRVAAANLPHGGAVFTISLPSPLD